eukprot:CAMPEP_0113658030 /NCGR_PEP_ID=MMETSP0017_2-20120614/31452_1 /TAXON_ID=2856 /ORGANISM="Cylindrotheca closterium" /LENGTH=90 /DNA_ID=CAMNT_0000572177 /DNA_START=6 /DNA_END=278 /DNA_ORIENTATION=- /assembly_acc=CAM_ASM_000147
MTHEERIAEHKKMKAAGIGMIVAGIGCFGGMFGGLSSSMSVGVAFGAAFGGAMGLIYGSMGPFGMAKEILAIDEAMEKEGKVGVETSDAV